MSMPIFSLLGQVAGLASQSAPVTLGPLTLSGPEAPTRIVIGGAQLAAIHKLPGGGRIIDAMGPDDGAIVWHGVFIGPAAASRVRTIDAIRTGGQPCTLAFGDYLFQVVVVDFQYSYESRGAVISYKIRAEKTDTLTQDSAPSALESAVSDFATAAQFLTNTRASIAAYGLSSAGAGAIGLSVIDGILPTVGVSSSILAGNGSSGLATQSAAAIAAPVASIGQAISQLSIGSLSGGGLPFTVGSGNDLVSVVQNAGALAAAVTSGEYINRASANLASANAETYLVGVHS